MYLYVQLNNFAVHLKLIVLLTNYTPIYNKKFKKRKEIKTAEKKQEKIIYMETKKEKTQMVNEEIKGKLTYFEKNGNKNTTIQNLVENFIVIQAFLKKTIKISNKKHNLPLKE